MKKSHLTRLFALVLFLSVLLTPISAQAATPLTANNFNATRYANDNPDLKAVYGTDATALWNHYVTFGAAENRKAYAQNGDVGYLKTATETTPAQPVSSETFNFKGYADKYPDLKTAFGYDQAALYNHYVTFGQAEGRSVPAAKPAAATATPAAPTTAAAATVDKATFDFKTYADNYPDLKAAFGYNQDALYNHYVSIGKAEGRTTAKTKKTPASTTTAAAHAATVSASDFNYIGYADKYPDLKAVYGYDAAALYNHFINYGQKEGRTFPAVGTTAVAAASVAPSPVFTSVIPNSVAVLGDSISTFSGFNHGGYALYYPHDPIKDVSQMWWFQAAAARGLTVVNNCSWSGSTVSGDANKQNGSAGCNWRRITDLAVNGQAPAVILIMLGTNDFNFGYSIADHKVGQTGASSWTFSGAYDIMLTRMKAVFPNSRIVCLSLPMLWGANGANINDRGDSVQKFNAKIAEITAAHGIQMIDIYSVFTGGDSIDGIHPNLKGMTEIAAKVAGSL